jgi:hypothetical protein
MKAKRPGLKKGFWTSDEDSILREIVSAGLQTGDVKHTGSWAKVAIRIPGRTSKQCRERWFHYLDPSINRGPFIATEDQLILEQHRVHGNKWSKIAQCCANRTSEAIKTRCLGLLKWQNKSTEQTMIETPQEKTLPLQQNHQEAPAAATSLVVGGSTVASKGYSCTLSSATCHGRGCSKMDSDNDSVVDKVSTDARGGCLGDVGTLSSVTFHDGVCSKMESVIGTVNIKSEAEGDTGGDSDNNNDSDTCSTPGSRTSIGDTGASNTSDTFSNWLVDFMDGLDEKAAVIETVSSSELNWLPGIDDLLASIEVDDYFNSSVESLLGSEDSVLV